MGPTQFKSHWELVASTGLGAYWQMCWKCQLERGDSCDWPKSGRRETVQNRGPWQYTGPIKERHQLFSTFSDKNFVDKCGLRAFAWIGWFTRSDGQKAWGRGMIWKLPCAKSCYLISSSGLRDRLRLSSLFQTCLSMYCTILTLFPALNETAATLLPILSPELEKRVLSTMDWRVQPRYDSSAPKFPTTLLCKSLRATL